jgi:hypothetical protein
LRQTHYGNTYPTHSLGPVSRWLGINRHDRYISTATWASARPHNIRRHELQGTTASFTTQEHGNDSLIWIEGRSATGIAGDWEPLSKYYEEFEHPLWREHLAEATKAGHGGGDYFTLREFVAAVRENRPPMIDVYDAVTWSSITPLSMLSIDRNHCAVDVPDFKNGALSSHGSTPMCRYT